MRSSTLEQGFAKVFSAACPAAPQPAREYVFAPPRRWRFDFAWPDRLVAVELDGGLFVGGGHQRGRRFAGDAAKQNAAVLAGWRVLRYTTVDLQERPVQCAEEVAWLLSVVSHQGAAK